MPLRPLLLSVGALVCALLAASASAQTDRPIRPLPLVAGQPDTVLVADFVVTDAPVTFASTSEVEAAYDPAAGTVVLTPRADFEGLTLVPFTVGGDTLALPVRAIVLAERTFRFDPEGEVTSVHLIGQFNDWSRTRDPMLDPDGDGVYEATVAVEPGRYEYKFYTLAPDGTPGEPLDPSNPETVPNGLGGTNNVLVVPPRFDETVALHVRGFGDRSDARLTPRNPHVGTAEFAYERGGRPKEPREEEAIVLLNNRPLAPDRVSIVANRIAVRVLPGDTGVLRVAVSEDDGLATRFASVELKDGALADDFAWRDAVIYQILVDRWRDGDPSNSRPVPGDSIAARANYHGGDLAGILQQLRAGYLDSLGVNTLWLSPVIENTDRAHREYPPPHRTYTGYHGYWPTHPERVEERFGDMALLQTVVREAQARGIRVLLDFVANHTHEDHPFFREHRDWFGTLDLPDGRKNLRLWDEQRLTTWFEPYLPSFDFSNHEALEAMTDNAVWWIETSGADGFRHDAVKHIPNRFWRTLTQKLRAVDAKRVARGEAPLYQIGETFGSYDLIASYVTPGQLDAQFNFNLYDTAKYVFLDPEADFAVLDAEMQRTLDVYGPDHVMGNLMDSHDKARFLAYADGDIARDAPDDKEVGWLTDIRVDDPASYRLAELYLAYLLTTPGVPTIYYGDEIGMTGANDPDNRRPMRWGDDVTPDEQALRERVSQLVRLRRDRSALRRGGFHTLHAEGDVWVYARAGADGRTLVALNKGDTPATLTLDVPEAITPLAAAPSYECDAAHDALTGEAVALEWERWWSDWREPSRLTLTVPATGYRIVDFDMSLPKYCGDG